MNPTDPQVLAVIQNEARYWARKMPGGWTSEADLVQDGVLLALKLAGRGYTDRDIGLLVLSLRNHHKSLVRNAFRARSGQAAAALKLLAQRPVDPARRAMARQVIGRLLEAREDAVERLLALQGRGSGWNRRLLRQALEGQTRSAGGSQGSEPAARKLKRRAK